MVPTTDQPHRVHQLGTHLSSEQFARLRAELEQLRAFRADQLIQLAHPADGGPRSSTHDEVTLTLRAGARSALHAVQAALWRMDEGTYGLCTVCRKPVDAATLEAVPHAALCSTCKHALPPG